MTPPLGATAILTERPQLDFVVDCLAERARAHSDLPPKEAEVYRMRVRDRAKDLLDEWSKIAIDLDKSGGKLQYQQEAGAAQRLLRDFLDPEVKRISPRFQHYRANRSLRDVEPSVNLWLRTMDGIDVEEDEE
jgi:hypothetical protein